MKIECSEEITYFLVICLSYRKSQYSPNSMCIASVLTLLNPPSVSRKEANMYSFLYGANYFAVRTDLPLWRAFNALLKLLTPNFLVTYTSVSLFKVISKSDKSLIGL